MRFQLEAESSYVRATRSGHERRSSAMALPKIRTILVGVATPDDRQQPAVQRAATLAAAFRAKVILFHSAFESYLSGRPFFETARLARSRGELVATRRARLE